MATTMNRLAVIWLKTLVCVILTAPSTPQEVPDNDVETNVLNLHYDHCRRPMTFSWKKLKCECPPPLKKVNNECLCDNCVAQEFLQWYHEGFSTDLPNYINEVFEEIDGELEEGEKSETQRVSENQKADLSKSEKPELDVSKPDEELTAEDEEGSLHVDEVSRRRRSLLEKDDTPAFIDSIILNVQGRLFRVKPPKLLPNAWALYNQMLNRVYFEDDYNMRDRQEMTEEDDDDDGGRRSTRRGRIVWRRPRPIAEELILPPEHRIFYPRPRIPIDNRKKILKLKGRQPQTQTFTDSVAGGSIEGGTAVGYDRAHGALSSYRGTGALAIGSGGGNAASAAYTGLGSSDLVTSSKGAYANGQGYIGEKALDGTSTTSLLVGTGDAVGLNARADKGSSSAAGISTKYIAAGSTAAFGPAVASISASPGQGDTDSSASFDKGLNSLAHVAAEGGPVAESAAVGDQKQDVGRLNMDVAGLFRSKHIRIEPKEFDFEEHFGLNS